MSVTGSEPSHQVPQPLLPIMLAHVDVVLPRDRRFSGASRWPHVERHGAVNVYETFTAAFSSDLEAPVVFAAVFLRSHKSLESVDPQFTMRRKMEQLREELELMEQLRDVSHAFGLLMNQTNTCVCVCSPTCVCALCSLLRASRAG